MSILDEDYDESALTEAIEAALHDRAVLVAAIAREAGEFRRLVAENEAGSAQTTSDVDSEARLEQYALHRSLKETLYPDAAAAPPKPAYRGSFLC